VVIPIDARGQVWVPYPQAWGSDFANLPLHRLLQYLDDVDMRGNVQEFFENTFVFIADISTGIADDGQTPLDRGVPLVTMHTALMNALLTRSFYRQWSFWEAVSLAGALALLVGGAALFQASRVLYVTGGLIVLGLVALTWVQCLHFTLLPIVTVGSGFAYVFFGLIVGLQVVLARDQAFIRGAFAKYVSEKVVDELLRHPDLLQLGGEERVLSVMFTDIADFTTLAEQMAPPELVRLLNAYLTEMTTIVLQEGGIIDKYVGDTIMAEFGAPLPIAQHADLAVRTALRMQRRLEELRPQWLLHGWPEVHCRVGINTGPMVVGNIGSEQVFNYTVIGDAVNLASRLEGANKYYETMVLISEFTYNALSSGLFRTRLLDVIRVKGKAQAVKVYEVYGAMGDPIAPATLQYYQAYNAGFEAYLARRFDLARAQFAAARAMRPTDAAAGEMLERLDDLDAEKLLDEWDGAKTFETK
jgi:adenylate cyclase